MRVKNQEPRTLTNCYCHCYCNSPLTAHKSPVKTWTPLTIIKPISMIFKPFLF